MFFLASCADPPCTAGDKITEILTHSLFLKSLFESSLKELLCVIPIWFDHWSQVSSVHIPNGWVHHWVSKIKLPSENVLAVCHPLNIINTLILPFQSVKNTEKSKHSSHLTVTQFHYSPQHRKASFKPFSRLSDKPAARPGGHSLHIFSAWKEWLHS